MNTIKITVITLVLMITSTFADFTIKDLFVSGGTQTVQDSTKNNSNSKKNNK